MSDRSGLVEAIYLAEIHGAMPHEVEVATAYAGRGLEGDRNFDDDDPDSCNITLIEAEAFDSFDLAPAQSRRQVLVRGVNLGDFIGRRFGIGDVECEGEERCEPCNHLAGLVGSQAVLKGLLHTGLRASILTDGTIRKGDTVRITT
jgi:hypothetical protein